MYLHDDLYEAALQHRAGLVRRMLSTIWLIVGLAALIAIAWAEPWSRQVFSSLIASGAPPNLVNYLGVPLVMMLRAVLLVEAFGYGYHRFFQHVGFFTRRAEVFRRNQRYHWTHHMLIYPIGRFYQRARAYVSAEPGVGLSWVIPGLVAAGLFVFTHGFNMGSVAFIAGIALYAWAVIDVTHSRFHEVAHSWTGSKYFQWLEQIHLLHHWDQRCNFTIVHPLMDILFGTYLSPKNHPHELRIALEDRELTASDIINWRYLLTEATPMERAEFISSAKHHQGSLRKVVLLLQVLEKRVATHPEDGTARDLRDKALEFQQRCRKRKKR